MNSDALSVLAEAVIRNLPDGICARRKLLEAVCKALPEDHPSRNNADALLGLLLSHEAAQLKFSFPPKPSPGGNGESGSNNNDGDGKGDGR
jgi:hypothetical protein